MFQAGSAGKNLPQIIGCPTVVTAGQTIGFTTAAAKIQRRDAPVRLQSRSRKSPFGNSKRYRTYDSASTLRSELGIMVLACAFLNSHPGR